MPIELWGSICIVRAPLHGIWRSREWQTGIPKLVRATKTDNFQRCAILLALIELDCHSRERQTPCRGALMSYDLSRGLRAERRFCNGRQVDQSECEIRLLIKDTTSCAECAFTEKNILLKITMFYCNRGTNLNS